MRKILPDVKVWILHVVGVFGALINRIQRRTRGGRERATDCHAAEQRVGVEVRPLVVRVGVKPVQRHIRGTSKLQIEPGAGGEVIDVLERCRCRCGQRIAEQLAESLTRHPLEPVA